MREESTGKRYGFCEYELPSETPFSKWEGRQDFFRAIDRVEPRVSISLFEKAFNHFIPLAWHKFPKTIPELIQKNLKGETNLSPTELFNEIMKQSYERNPEVWLNHPIQMPLVVLLGKFERFYPHEITDAFPSWAALKENPLANELCDKIQEWSEEWNLNEDWCRDFAVTALCVWIQDRWARWDNSRISFCGTIPIAVRKHLLQRVSEYWLTDNTLVSKFKQMILDKAGTERFKFKFRHIEFRTMHWNPFGMTRKHWKEDTIRDFEIHLYKLKCEGGKVPNGILTRFRNYVDSYLRTIEEVPKEARIKKSPRRWARHHFDWAVQFQVQKLSITKIENLHKKSKGAISDGINGVLDFIRLERRPDLPAGMPKGTRIRYYQRSIVRN